MDRYLTFISIQLKNIDYYTIITLKLLLIRKEAYIIILDRIVK